MSNVKTPAARSSHEIEIKKSRFIAWLCPANNRAQAMHWLAQARTDYPDARHHCWAYLLGSHQQPTSLACSDDGEPAGTAGKPILNVLQHKPLANAMLIVIRYFGGIKLGAGGLVRAYSQAAQQCYEHAALENHLVLQRCAVSCEFKDEQGVRHWAQQHQALIEAVQYSNRVHLQLHLPSTALTALTQWVQEQPSVELEQET